MAKAVGGVQITFPNMDQVLRDLAAVGANASEVLGAAVLAGAEIVKREAIANGPGNQIDKKLHTATKTRAEAHIGPVKRAWYYRFAETGVRPHHVAPTVAKALQFEGGYFASADPGGFPARPFLRPAIDENERKITDASGKVIKRAIE